MVVNGSTLAAWHEVGNGTGAVRDMHVKDLVAQGARGFTFDPSSQLYAARRAALNPESTAALAVSPALAVAEAARDLGVADDVEVRSTAAGLVGWWCC